MNETDRLHRSLRNLVRAAERLKLIGERMEQKARRETRAADRPTFVPSRMHNTYPSHEFVVMPGD